MTASLIGAVSWGIAAISLIAMALILRDLSRRLGQALRMKKYYMLYDASVVLLLLATAAIVAEYLNIGLADGSLLTASMLLIVASTLLILGTTIKYWAWIFPEVLAPQRK